MKRDSPRPEEFRRAADLRAALRQFMRASEQAARSNKLTPQRYTLLLMIKGAADGSERSTVTELAGRLQLAQSTVTELVHRAEAVGLIAREPSSQDGRVAYLSLTAEGERRLAGTVSSLGEERRRLAGVLQELTPKARQR
jgi:DNA-binding MarR family transcriptional regulator